MRIEKLRAVVLDLDGVVYLEHRVLPGVRAAIARMRASGIGVYFVTNNANETRAGFARRLGLMGIPCRPGEIMNAGFATAYTLRRRIPRGSKVFVFGPHGVARELAAWGFRPVTVRTRRDWERFRRRPPRVRAVVVMFDPALTYWTLCGANRALAGGALLVACNLDSTYPGTDGTLPGTGSLVSLLMTSSGREPILIGKPSPLMFRLLLREHGIAARNALVVGDRIPIDIAGGKAAGTHTALVLTGIDTRADLAKSRIKPDLVLKSLPDLLRLPGFPCPAKPDSRCLRQRPGPANPAF